MISTTASTSTHGTIRMPVFQVDKRSFRAQTSCLHRRRSLEGVHSLTPRPDSGRQWWHGQTPTGPGHYARPERGWAGPQAAGRGGSFNGRCCGQPTTKTGSKGRLALWGSGPKFRTPVGCVLPWSAGQGSPPSPSQGGAVDGVRPLPRHQSCWAQLPGLTRLSSHIAGHLPGHAQASGPPGSSG